MGVHIHANHWTQSIVKGGITFLFRRTLYPRIQVERDAQNTRGSDPNSQRLKSYSLHYVISLHNTGSGVGTGYEEANNKDQGTET